MKKTGSFFAQSDKLLILSKTNLSHNKLLSSIASGGVLGFIHKISKALANEKQILKKLKISNVHKLLSTQM